MEVCGARARGHMGRVREVFSESASCGFGHSRTRGWGLWGVGLLDKTSNPELFIGFLKGGSSGVCSPQLPKAP